MSDWISVEDRLPDHGQEIIAYIDIDTIDPDEAYRMKLFHSCLKGMSFKERSVSIGGNRRIEIYSNIPVKTKYVRHGYAHTLEDDDNGDEILLVLGTRLANRLDDNHGYCVTHWMPLPEPPQ